MSVIDSAFISTESEESPMHVACLLIFQLPARSKTSFSHNLYGKMRKQSEAVYPFNHKVVLHRGHLPAWDIAENFAIDEHLFYHHLPGHGSRDQLHELVAGLHEDLLPRDRPL
jgi:hypothetical protein